MNQKGFTLIELLIVIAIIVIAVALLSGLIKPRKAGAHELFPTDMRVALADNGVSYRWNPDGHTITIIDKGSATWENAQAACAALAATAPDVTPLTVTMPGIDTSGTAELRWVDGGRDEGEPAENAFGTRPTLTNLPTTDAATC